MNVYCTRQNDEAERMRHCVVCHSVSYSGVREFTCTCECQNASAAPRAVRRKSGNLMASSYCKQQVLVCVCVMTVSRYGMEFDVNYCKEIKWIKNEFIKNEFIKNLWALWVNACHFGLGTKSGLDVSSFGTITSATIFRRVICVLYDPPVFGRPQTRVRSQNNDSPCRSTRPASSNRRE